MKECKLVSSWKEKALPPAFFLLARYVLNVAKGSISDQCNIEDRPTDDRHLFLEEPS